MDKDVTSWTGAPPERWDAFYVRVTQEESVKTDISIPTQIARAQEIAAARGWKNFRIYVEPKHVSGELWIDKRSALRRIVEDILVGRITRVCARHTDRLWRGAEIQTKLLSIFRSHNVELWDYTHQHDYKSAHGKFSLQVLGAASELEVNLTAERIREMKRGKARKGKPGGGPPPFGYTSQSRRILELRAAGHSADEAYAKACTEFPVGKCWYVDEKEAEVVRLIFEFYTAPEYRWGSKRIARRLHELGHRSRNGYPWLAGYVRRILDNPAYAGFTSYDEAAYDQRVPSQRPRHRQELFPGEHQSLISADRWRQAQKIKSGENTVKRWKTTAKERRVFLLTGILCCPQCGKRMQGKWGKKSKRTYYMCSRRHHAGPEVCSFPILDAGQLDREAWAWVHELITSPRFVLEHLERLQKKLAAQKPDVEKRTAALARRRDEVKAALAKYFKLFESSKDPSRDDALVDRVKELRTELQAIETELADLKTKVVPFPRRLTEERVKACLEKLRVRLDERPEQQRALLHELKVQHGFQVKAVSKEDVVFSIALPVREFVVEGAVAVGGGGDRRLFTVLNGGGVSGGSRGTGLPEPGGPSSSRLCPPAAATSSARRAVSSPRTSQRSSSPHATGRATNRVRDSCFSPRRNATTSGSVPAPNTGISSTAAASPAQSAGRISARAPAARAWMATGRLPATRRRAPSSDSSPSSTTPSSAARGRMSCDARIAIATGRSNAAPSLRTSAGARLTVMRRGGSLSPVCSSAARTRTPPSLTAQAGRPTTW